MLTQLFAKDCDDVSDNHFEEFAKFDDSQIGKRTVE
jgi:hypothetical protein